MWINPKYADRVQAPAPPRENGERLVTFPRGNGSEMRVNLSTFEGKPFVSIRLWERDQAGGWWPVKGKGCSIRLGEAPALAEALASLASNGNPPREPVQAPARQPTTRPDDSEGVPDPGRDSGAHNGPDRPTDKAGHGAANAEHNTAEHENPKFVDRGRPVRPPWDAAKLAGSGHGEGFDEFADG